MRTQPIWQLLAPGRFGIGVAGCAQHGHEDLRLKDFSREAIPDRYGLSAVIDEQFLAGTVRLAHGKLQRLGEPAVERAELAITVGVIAVSIPVFLPEQLQSHAFTLEFLMDDGAVGGGVLAGCDRGWRVTMEPRAQEVIGDSLG